MCLPLPQKSRKVFVPGVISKGNCSSACYLLVKGPISINLINLLIGQGVRVVAQAGYSHKQQENSKLPNGSRCTWCFVRQPGSVIAVYARLVWDVSRGIELSPISQRGFLDIACRLSRITRPSMNSKLPAFARGSHFYAVPGLAFITGPRREANAITAANSFDIFARTSHYVIQFFRLVVLSAAGAGKFLQDLRPQVLIVRIN